MVKSLIKFKCMFIGYQSPLNVHVVEPRNALDLPLLSPDLDPDLNTGSKPGKRAPHPRSRYRP